MKIKIIFTFTICLLISFIAKGQSLLSADDLIKIRQMKDNEIAMLLSEKGYHNHTNSDKTQWTFQRKFGESAIYILTNTTDMSGHIQTRYGIYNRYLFKEFTSNIIKDQYSFDEIKVIDKKSFFAFKKGDITLKMIIYKDEDDFYSEIVID